MATSFSKSRLKNYKLDRPGKFREMFCIRNLLAVTQAEISYLCDDHDHFLALFLRELVPDSME